MNGPGLSASERALFKAYDVRGAAPDPLAPALAFRIGAAFVRHIAKESDPAPRIGCGRDMRRTSPALAAAFRAGLRSRGARITDYGLIPTDAMWFAVRRDRLDGGAMITASHNPPGDNGIKLVSRGATPVFAETGLPEIRRQVEALRSPSDPAAAPGPTRDITSAYRDFLHSAVDARRLPRLRVVLDAGNGMGGVMAGPVFEGLPGEFLPLDFRPDGSFPGRGANPLDPANRVELARRIRSERADFGVLWDGDADRCAFLDGDGIFVPGDFTTALLAPAEIAEEPGARVAYDLRSSRAVPDRVRRAGGVPCPCRVGHAYMKMKMREVDARFGGELSGHFYSRLAGYADNAILPILRMIERIGATGRSLDELAGDLRRDYFALDEESIRVRDAAAALDAVRAGWPGGRVRTLDGLTVDFPDWRFTLRPSNTEPVLRLTIEAFRDGLVERRQAELLDVLGQHDPDPDPGARIPTGG